MNEPTPGPSRRSVLAIGAAAVGAIAVGASGLAWWTASQVTGPDPAAPGGTDGTDASGSPGDGSAGETFREPEVRSSARGRLDL
ncbi:hypothetical protein, partial [Agromyces binzhouensis]